MSTEKPNPLRGYKEHQDTKKDVRLDEKKFKEELSKVQQSDASEQGKKRNLKKSEEEIDDESLLKKEEKPPSNLFAFLMEEKTSDDLLPQTPQNVKSTRVDASNTSTFTLDENELGKIQTPSEEMSVDEILSEFSNLSSTAASQPPKEPSSIQGAQPSRQEKVASTHQAPSKTPEEEKAEPSTKAPTAPARVSSTPRPEYIAKKETEDTSLLAHKKASKAQAAKKAQEKVPELKLERGKEAPIPVEPVEKKEATPPIEQKPVVIKEPPSIKPQIITAELPEEVPKEARETLLKQGVGQEMVLPAPKELQKPIQGVKKTAEITTEVTEKPAIKSFQGGFKDSSQENNEEARKQAGSLMQSSKIVPFIPSREIDPPPIYAQLPAQVYELFERMISAITIEFGKNIVKTTVTVSMKGSIFDQAEIILTRHSTAQNSFNLTIAASPEGQAMIMENLPDLEKSLKESKLPVSINVLPPELLKSHRAFVRKESTGDEDKQGA